MATITVGHVDVDGLWVEFQANSSLTAQEVIVRSGMKPRDGTRVDCYLTSGEIVADSVAPGQTVMVGTHPPKGGAIAVSPVLRSFDVKWDKQHEGEGGRRLVTGSGYIGGGCTMWVPGIRSGRKIRAVELMRTTNRNGKLHAKGHRIRWDPVPYYKNDVALVASSGHQRFRLFDPRTGELTIPVTIEQDSFDRAKRAEAVLGSRFLWTIKVLNFDEDGRRVLASVEEGFTWEGVESGTIGASHATHAKGKVAATNPELNFVVLDFEQCETPSVGRKYSIHRAGRRVGRVRVVGPAWETYTVASIIEGDFRIGDQTNEEPHKTPNYWPWAQLVEWSDRRALGQVKAAMEAARSRDIAQATVLIDEVGPHLGDRPNLIYPIGALLLRIGQGKAVDKLLASALKALPNDKNVATAKAKLRPEASADSERDSDDCSDGAAGDRPIYQEMNPRGYW